MRSSNSFAARASPNLPQPRSASLPTPDRPIPTMPPRLARRFPTSCKARRRPARIRYSESRRRTSVHSADGNPTATLIAPCFPEYQERTFVVLGTSHYGEPDRFGLTRKPFVTPFGEATTAVDLVDGLAHAAPGAVRMEDYCHAVEHSIEFQVLFLQHIYGPNIRVLPILCGSFARSVYEGGKPEANEDVARFFGALGEMSAREGGRLFWVLGVDMAHMGRRYGDPAPARADEGLMAAVAARDQNRINSVTQADADAFWNQVQENQDDLKWCGSSPIYTFLKVVPGARGTLRRYQQWNIDEQSVVSFAALTFRK